jgi:hypothetical protein
MKLELTDRIMRKRIFKDKSIKQPKRSVNMVNLKVLISEGPKA